ncbi:MAG: LCCL domain-containing protein [Bacteroidales bacterium]
MEVSELLFTFGTGLKRKCFKSRSNTNPNHDSNIGKAAVHAGLLKVGEQKVLEVTIVPGQSSYHGNTQNGITTNNYDQWHGSFKFEP